MRTLPLLVATTLLSLSCSDSSPRGHVTGTLDEGDWRDTGPFAGCAVDTAPQDCGAPSTFDPTGCTPGGLASLELDGVYTVHVRGRNPRYAGAPGFTTQALRLGASGEQYAGGLVLDTRQVDASGNVFLSSSRAEPSTGAIRRRSYLGCQSPEPDRLQGCYVECVGDRLEVEGTFDARKVTPRAGEPEASGLERVSETFVPEGVPVDVYVTHGHAYVVSLGGGLFVYDLADPAHPVLTEHVLRANDNNWNGVWAYQDALYVASAARGVIVFDLTDPGHPVEVFATGRQRTNVHTVFVQGARLFAASPAPSGEVLVYSLVDPFAPQLTGTFQAAGFDAATSYGPHDMFAFEDRLYVSFWRAGYVIASLTNPDTPRELGAYRYERSTSHASAVGRFGGRLIAFEGGEDWGAHLRVLDVTDPAAIHLVGEYRLGEHVSLHNLVLVGTKLYVAWYQEGVRVLDVSTPEAPREVAHYNTFRAGDPGRGSSFYDGAIGMRVPGDGYLYVVDTSRGLLVLREP